MTDPQDTPPTAQSWDPAHGWDPVPAPGQGPPPGPGPGYGPPQGQWQGPPGQPYPPPYAGQGYPPPGYPGYPPYYAAPPLNTLAILALVLAVFVLPPLGIYFGKKAKEQIAQTGERGTELATAGIVVGWVLTCVYGLFVLVWCGFAGSAVLGVWSFAGATP